MDLEKWLDPQYVPTATSKKKKKRKEGTAPRHLPKKFSAFNIGTSVHGDESDGEMRGTARTEVNKDQRRDKATPATWHDGEAPQKSRTTQDLPSDPLQGKGKQPYNPLKPQGQQIPHTWGKENKSQGASEGETGRRPKRTPQMEVPQNTKQDGSFPPVKIARTVLPTHKSRECKDTAVTPVRMQDEPRAKEPGRQKLTGGVRLNPFLEFAVEWPMTTTAPESHGPVIHEDHRKQQPSKSAQGGKQANMRARPDHREQDHPYKPWSKETQTAQESQPKQNPTKFIWKGKTIVPTCPSPSETADLATPKKKALLSDGSVGGQTPHPQTEGEGRNDKQKLADDKQEAQPVDSKDRTPIRPPRPPLEGDAWQRKKGDLETDEKASLAPCCDTNRTGKEGEQKQTPGKTVPHNQPTTKDKSPYKKPCTVTTQEKAMAPKNLPNRKQVNIDLNKEKQKQKAKEIEQETARPAPETDKDQKGTNKKDSAPKECHSNVLTISETGQQTRDQPKEQVAIGPDTEDPESQPETAGKRMGTRESDDVVGTPSNKEMDLTRDVLPAPDGEQTKGQGGRNKPTGPGDLDSTGDGAKEKKEMSGQENNQETPTVTPEQNALQEKTAEKQTKGPATSQWSPPPPQEAPPPGRLGAMINRLREMGRALQRVPEPLRSSISNSPLVLDIPSEWHAVTLEMPYPETSRRFADRAREQDPGLLGNFLRADLNVILRDPTVHIGDVGVFLQQKYNANEQDIVSVTGIPTLPRLMALTEELMIRDQGADPACVTRTGMPEGEIPIHYHIRSANELGEAQTTDWLMVAAHRLHERLERGQTRQDEEAPSEAEEAEMDEHGCASEGKEDLPEREQDFLTEDED